MTTRTVLESLLGAVLETPPCTRARSDAIGDLVGALVRGGDLAAWTRSLWMARAASSQVHVRSELVSIASLALFEYLLPVRRVAADRNRIGVLNSVAYRAAAASQDANGESGLSGVSNLRRRALVYRRAANAISGKDAQEPDSADVLAYAAAHEPPNATKNGLRLKLSEVESYRSGGRIAVTVVELDDLHHLRAEDDVERSATASAAVRAIVRRVRGVILDQYAHKCGLLWFAVVLARHRAFSGRGRTDEVRLVSRAAGVPLTTGRRWHDLVLGDDRCGALISRTDDPLELLVEVSRLAPGELGLLTYLHSWLRLASDGERPSGSDVIDDIATTTGTRMGVSTASAYGSLLGEILSDAAAGQREG